MNRRGHRGRVDSNHGEIMEGLRKAGMKPVSLASVGDGCPDILVGWRGLNVVLEVKDEKGKLTAAEVNFLGTWPGQYGIVRSAEEAVRTVLEHGRRLGVV